MLLTSPIIQNNGRCIASGSSCNSERQIPRLYRLVLEFRILAVLVLFGDLGSDDHFYADFAAVELGYVLSQNLPSFIP